MLVSVWVSGCVLKNKIFHSLDRLSVGVWGRQGDVDDVFVGIPQSDQVAESYSEGGRVWGELGTSGLQTTVEADRLTVPAGVTSCREGNVERYLS